MVVREMVAFGEFLHFNFSEDWLFGEWSFEEWSFGKWSVYRFVLGPDKVFFYFIGVFIFKFLKVDIRGKEQFGATVLFLELLLFRGFFSLFDLADLNQSQPVIPGGTTFLRWIPRP
jgi:hypothetical protein